jgi:TMEM175 potassium channel family protein
MTVPDPDHFEMRRLESLSNTIFGVAMTLLAYDLPKAGEFKSLPGWTNPAGELIKSLPDWIDLYHLYSGRVAGLILSFVIAGLFWLSHHRRLARYPRGSRGVVLLNLVFLLSIILLPVTNGLYGSYRLSSAVAVLYCLHLTAIASLNAVLWWLATRDGKPHPELLGAAFPVMVFLPCTAIALFAPQYVTYFWFLAFGGLLIRPFTDRRA